MGAVDHIQHAPARQGKTNVRQETHTSGRVRRLLCGCGRWCVECLLGRRNMSGTPTTMLGEKATSAK
jgi:hypothetical protein